jgi:arylsulfate sulfotransferase
MPTVARPDRNRARILAAALLFATALHSRAVIITSGPVLTPATNAPLATLLQLATDNYSRVSVSVNDGTNVWTRDFYDYDTNHSMPLAGFKANRTNVITVTVHDWSGASVPASAPLEFVTGPLPTNYPPAVVLKSQPDKIEPGYLLNIMSVRGVVSIPTLSILDNSGEVVWYSGRYSQSDVRQLENGNLLLPLVTNITEVNLLGETVDNWIASTNLPLDSHEGLPTDHGTILYLNTASRQVNNFPTSTTNPAAPLVTTNVQYDRIVEISITNGTVLNVWSPIDVLDPTRIDYSGLAYTPQGFDAEHANAITEDPRDDSLIVSMRNQDAVIKFSRSTGQLKWILGPHENWGPAWQPYLLTPVGQPFEWNYAQHAPIITSRGTLLLYDDGNYRASPFDTPLANSNTYSRAVEFNIDETNMTVTQVWDYGRTNDDRLFTGFVGSTYELPQTGNILINYGFVSLSNGVPINPFSPGALMLRLKEVTHDPNPEVVLDIAFFDFQNTSPTYTGSGAYRTHWIPDLYPVRNARRVTADLMTAAGGINPRSDRILMPDLRGVLTALGRHDTRGAIRSLRRFQSHLPRVTLPPGAAQPLFYQAQQLIDALQAGKSDYATAQLTSVFPVYSPEHGIADLIGAVSDAKPRNGNLLILCLSYTAMVLGQHDPAAAVRGLFVFEWCLRASRLDARRTAQFNREAQRIMSAIQSGTGP